MEQTVKELLYDAIYYDESLVAHAVYYAVQKGIVHLDEPASRIPKELDYTEIFKMRDENYLQMCTIKLFTIPLEPKRHALYLAETEDAARAKHHKIYGQLAQRIIDISHRMDYPLFYEETGLSKTFRELKREAVKFPYYAGEVLGR
ncbi:hypothetical protein [Sporosarcina highlanderae]|uniref:Uncharacterized protein n=1 Tax=Sporosarcina highlanderae TaxID=3035916 RepID=A0ABT8JSR7_9BACL|nr:hypothetical protein [Sporosarcina highlanderae]MDN4608185.1 hypothetical protein [Sporosarcina highlanderae]